MKIAFTTTGKNWNSILDSVFGRAEGYILYDDETNEIIWHSNLKNRNAGHGAGVQAGQYVAGLGAKIVITGGDVGPKATDVLKKAGIKIFIGASNKSVKEALSAYKNDELTEL